MKFFKRPPDLIVGHKEAPYMLRWWVIPRNNYFNVYLHKFLRSDEDRALHDHPWWNMSLILKGEYIEHVPENDTAWRLEHNRSTLKLHRKRFRPVFRRANAIHRIELMRQYETVDDWINNRTSGLKSVWSLFITGPVIREWGFWCPFGFRLSKDFLKKRDGVSEVGRGCE